MTYAYIVVLLVLSLTGHLLCATLSQEYNLGTVLFFRKELTQPFWKQNRLGTLEARRFFQALAPSMLTLFYKENFGIESLLNYVNATYADILQSHPHDNDVKRTLYIAFSDVVGGFLKLFVIPSVKMMFYYGVIDYNETLAVQQLYERILEELVTDGAGWHNFILDSEAMAMATAFRKTSSHSKSPKRCSFRQNPCEPFVYSDMSLTGLKIPMPQINWEEKTVFLPVVNETNFSLYSPKHVGSLRRYYDNARCCASMQGRVAEDFEKKFQNWVLSQMLFSMLVMEPVCPPLADLLPVIDTTDLNETIAATRSPDPGPHSSVTNMFILCDVNHPASCKKVETLHTLSCISHMVLKFLSKRDNLITMAIIGVLLICFWKCYHNGCLKLLKGDTSHKSKYKNSRSSSICQTLLRKADHLPHLRSAHIQSPVYSTETMFLKSKIFEGILPPHCDTSRLPSFRHYSSKMVGSGVVNELPSRRTSVVRKETKSDKMIEVEIEPSFTTVKRTDKKFRNLQIAQTFAALPSCFKPGIPIPIKPTANNVDASQEKKKNAIPKTSNQRRFFIKNKTNVPIKDKNINIPKTCLPEPKIGIEHGKKETDKSPRSRQSNKGNVPSKLPRNLYSIKKQETEKGSKEPAIVTKPPRKLLRPGTITTEPSLPPLEESSKQYSTHQQANRKERKPRLQHSKIPRSKNLNKPTEDSHKAETQQGITTNQILSSAQKGKPVNQNVSTHLETEKKEKCPDATVDLSSKQDAITLMGLVQKSMCGVSKTNASCSRILKKTYARCKTKLNEEKKAKMFPQSHSEDKIPLIESDSEVITNKSSFLVSIKALDDTVKLTSLSRGKNSRTNVSL